jgi:hyaluronan synthase
MIVSIGVRQIPHLRRRPRDILRLPLFVLQLTFVMAPIRVLAFATMLHQSWSTRPAGLLELPVEAARAESAHA